MCTLFFTFSSTAQSSSPLKVAVIGLSHSHVHWILGEMNRGDFEIVGIVEKNKELAERFAKQYNFPLELIYKSSADLIKSKKPEAVTAFGSTYEHLEVVQTFAPLGIHVMVEKPMAVNMEHATEMATLAKKHNIHLLTNYETTWYASNNYAKALTKEKENFGELRKIVIHDGHPGPMEIGVNKEFLEWLTDPILNGGGAITDFGCYGANLSNWLMDGESPLTVSATTQQIKPEIYPKVDDEATIVLTYPKCQVIIQASWNWPYNRKDMEVYGKKAFVIAKDRTNIIEQYGDQETLHKELNLLPKPLNDPFHYLKAVIRNEIKVQPYDLSSLENNLLVVKILDAAKKSANSGRVVNLNDE